LLPEEAKQKLQIEGNVFAFAATGAASYSRKQLDDLAEKAKSLGARGAYFVKVAPKAPPQLPRNSSVRKM